MKKIDIFALLFHHNTQFEPFKEKIYEWLELGLSYEKIIKHLGFGSKSALYSFVKHRRDRVL